MTEMRVLCRALAGTGASAEVLHRQLRWFGCRGSVHGLVAHLNFLVQLEPGFACLATEYPRLANACALARDAGRLLGELDKLNTGLSSPEEVLPTSADTPLAKSLAAAFSGPDLDCPLAQWPVGLAPSPMGLTFAAAAYMLVRVWTGHVAAPPTCARLIAALSDLEDPRHRLFDAALNAEETGASISVSRICGELVKLAKAREAKGKGGAVPTGQFHSLELASFADILARTDATQPYQPKLIHPKKPPAALARTEDDEEDEDDAGPVREWGNRGSQLLLDRELLPEATYGLSAREASALAACFGPAPAMHPDRIATRTEVLASVGGCLALAGALTASSIAEAAEIPVEVITGDATPVPTVRAVKTLLTKSRGAGRKFVLVTLMRSGETVFKPLRMSEQKFDTAFKDLPK